jgi:hypothetical protein
MASLISQRNRFRVDRVDKSVAAFTQLTIKSFTGTFASYEKGRLLLQLHQAPMKDKRLIHHKIPGTNHLFSRKIFMCRITLPDSSRRADA